MQHAAYKMHYTVCSTQQGQSCLVPADQIPHATEEVREDDEAAEHEQDRLHSEHKQTTERTQMNERKRTKGIACIHG